MSMVQEAIHNCSALEPAGWDQGDLSGSMATGSDGAAPLSASGIIDETIPNGMEGGSQAAYMENVFGSKKKCLQVIGAIKWSAAYKGHPSGNNKLIQIYSDSVDPGNYTIFELFGDGSEAAEPPGDNNGTNFYPGFVLQGGEDTALVGTVAITRNAWFRFKFQITNNTLGSANGSVKLWIDTGSGRTLAIDQSGLRIVADDRNNTNHNGIVVGSLWGGGGGVFLAADQHCYWDHIDPQVADAVGEFTDTYTTTTAGGSVRPALRANLLPLLCR